MTILDALWYGEIAPCAAGEHPDDVQIAINHRILQNEAELQPLLPEKAQEILEKLHENRTELSDYENRLAFRSGFRMGAQLVIDVLTNVPSFYEENE